MANQPIDVGDVVSNWLKDEIFIHLGYRSNENSIHLHIPPHFTHHHVEFIQNLLNEKKIPFAIFGNHPTSCWCYESGEYNPPPCKWTCCISFNKQNITYLHYECGFFLKI